MTVNFPPEIIDSIMQRRGRLHVIEALDPAHTALVVIDMQNFFVEEGQGREVPSARDITPNINRLAAAARRAGVAVVWVQMALDDSELDKWSVILHMNRGEESRALYGNLAPGQHGYELWHELELDPDDLIVEKNRYSAFIQGSSDLHAILQERGIDTLLLAGTLTNVCCESTGRDAMMLNYKVLMVSDANAAVTPAAHQEALNTFFVVFGDVQSTDEVIAMLA